MPASSPLHMAFIPGVPTYRFTPLAFGSGDTPASADHTQ